MRTSHLPRQAGVYWIINVQNGKMYIGSSKDIQVRVLQHRRNLRLCKHDNIILQRAWDKYGEDSFHATVLELVPELERLIEREQYWLNLIKPFRNGYNVRKIAETNLGLKWTEEGLNNASFSKSKPLGGYISPEGALVTILNMRSFCKQNNLTAANMYALKVGRCTSHKGWTHVNAKPKAREWVKTYDGFIDPDGKPVAPIVNMEQFCQERGLIASNMTKVYRGENKSHRGWTCTRK